MTPLLIQHTLATIALTLQGLLGILAQVDATPALRPLIIPQVQATLANATATLHNLTRELPTATTQRVSVGVGTASAGGIAGESNADLRPLALARVSEALATRTREATVNILCMTTSGNRIQSATGSGVVIDPRGVVLTNAHVAQFLLLADHPRPGAIDCTIRTGSPAAPTYRARLLYISKEWVESNRTAIQERHPTGTGENDFAFLLITGRVNNAPLVGAAPHIPLETAAITLADGEEVLLVGYPAELTGSILATRGLHQVSGLSHITKGFYFNDANRGALDLVEVSGTVLSQGGSSGGAVVRAATGKLLGIMVTTTDAETTGERELYAITSAHISTRFQKETGQSLESYLSRDLIAHADTFDTTIAPHLRTLILEALP